MILFLLLGITHGRRKLGDQGREFFCRYWFLPVRRRSALQRDVPSQAVCDDYLGYPGCIVNNRTTWTVTDFKERQVVVSKLKCS